MKKFGRLLMSHGRVINMDDPKVREEAIQVVDLLLTQQGFSFEHPYRRAVQNAESDFVRPEYKEK